MVYIVMFICDAKWLATHTGKHFAQTDLHKSGCYKSVILFLSKSILNTTNDAPRTEFDFL